MANLVLGYPNHVDSTFFPVVFSSRAGAWETALPLTNLSVPELADVARSTSLDLEDTKFVIDYGVERPIRLRAIPRCNISRNGLIRIRGVNAVTGDLSDAGYDPEDDFGTPLYDTGWLEVWTVIYAWGSLPWGSSSWWDGKLSPEEAADYDPAFINLVAIEQSGRYELWEIDDTGNDDGYIDLARLFVAPGWQVSVNFDYGAGLGVETDTAVESVPGGPDYYDRQDGRRVVRLTLSMVQQNEALSQAFEMMRRLGIDRQLYVVLDPDDAPNLHRLSWLGTMVELSPLEYTFFDHMAVPFQIREVL